MRQRQPKKTAAEPPRRAVSSGEKPPLNHVQQQIIQWLEKVKFHKKWFGGVDEQDVWKKIQELDRMYETALLAERVRYDGLLAQQRKAAAAGIEHKSSIARTNTIPDQDLTDLWKQRDRRSAAKGEDA